MNELVQRNENGQAITTSLLVAEKFEKRHDHVIDSIREILSSPENSGVLSMFVEASYIASNGKQNPMYIMNRDGFTLLAMGFTGAKALQFKIDYINAFNRMEEALKSQYSIPQTFSEALRLAADKTEENERLTIENRNKDRIIEENAPKVLFTNAVAGSKNSCLVGELAKLITQNGHTIGQNRLFVWMRENGYMGKRGEMYNIPLQQYVEQGLFDLKKGARSGNDGVMYTTITPKVTGKGQIYFVNRFLNSNHPIITT